MESNNYGSARYYYNPPHDVYLKPLANSDITSLHSTLNDDDYRPLAPTPYTDDQLQRLEEKDAGLKYRIRVLKIVSRVLAVILSATTVVPLAMTVIKFLQTRNIHYTVDGEQRTAWAEGTITAYTYTYLGISAASFLLNTAILLAYLRGIKHANTTATVAGYWTTTVMVAHVVIWTASVIVYRIGREPVDNKFKDLWGWTCSNTAAQLQDVLTDVNFKKYCHIQASSFYFGIANVAAALLTGVIYVFAMMRVRSKKRVKQASSREVDDAMEPLRY